MATKREQRILDALARYAIKTRDKQAELLAHTGTHPESRMDSWPIGIQYAAVEANSAAEAFRIALAAIEGGTPNWMTPDFERYLLNP